MRGERITISLTRYREPDSLIRSTLESIAAQKGVRADVLFLDQAGNSETQEYVDSLSSEDIRFNYRSELARPLSFMRNTAIRESANDVILFIDSDAIADPGWARELTGTLQRDKVALVGGRILPLWHKPPLAVSRCSIVMDQYSMLDLGEEEKPSRKVVGASFGLDRGILGDVAYFDERLGRRPGVLLGGEESELADRVRQSGAEVWYNGRSQVRHQVLPERIRYSWILRRIYWQGYTRALVGGMPTGSNRIGLANYMVLPLIFPFYLLGYAKGKLFNQISVRNRR